MLQESGFENGAFKTHYPPAGDDVTVYLVGADSKIFAAASKETLAEPFPGTAITLVGASGFANGLTALEFAEGVVVPVAFVAVVTKVYEVLLDNGEIVQVNAGAKTVQLAPPGEAVIV